jgi:hypothetical protein
MPYEGNFGRVWRLQYRRANHSHCEICNDLVLLAKEKVLQDIFDKLIEIGRCY